MNFKPSLRTRQLLARILGGTMLNVGDGRFGVAAVYTSSQLTSPSFGPTTAPTFFLPAPSFTVGVQLGKFRTHLANGSLGDGLLAISGGAAAADLVGYDLSNDSTLGNPPTLFPPISFFSGGNPS